MLTIKGFPLISSKTTQLCIGTMTLHRGWIPWSMASIAVLKSKRDFTLPISPFFTFSRFSTRELTGRFPLNSDLINSCISLISLSSFNSLAKASRGFKWEQGFIVLMRAYKSDPGGGLSRTCIRISLNATFSASLLPNSRSLFSGVSFPASIRRRIGYLGSS